MNIMSSDMVHAKNIFYQKSMFLLFFNKIVDDVTPTYSKTPCN